jgi:hypothetical protein
MSHNDRLEQALSVPLGAPQDRVYCGRCRGGDTFNEVVVFILGEGAVVRMKCSVCKTEVIFPTSGIKIVEE